MFAIMWKNKEGNFEWENGNMFDRELWDTRYAAEKALQTFYATLPFDTDKWILSDGEGWVIIEVKKVHKEKVQYELH